MTRERGRREAMLRFVVAPDHRVVPDLAARLPGRGIWLSARRDVLEPRRSRAAFSRAARVAVTLPPDLLADLETGLTRRIGDLLGFARRAGQAIAGFQKARAWLDGGRAALVMQAADGSAKERARFLGASRGSGSDAVTVVTALSASALGSVFGRDHVVHVAIARGRLAEAIATEAGRLAGVVGTASAPAAGEGLDEGLTAGSGRAARRAAGSARTTEVVRTADATHPARPVERDGA